MRNTGIEFTESELNNSLFCSSLERVLNLYVHVYKQTNLVKHRKTQWNHIICGELHLSTREIIG